MYTGMGNVNDSAITNSKSWATTTTDLAKNRAAVRSNYGARNGHKSRRMNSKNHRWTSLRRLNLRSVQPANNFQGQSFQPIQGAPVGALRGRREPRPERGGPEGVSRSRPGTESRRCLQGIFKYFLVGAVFLFLIADIFYHLSSGRHRVGQPGWNWTWCFRWTQTGESGFRSLEYILSMLRSETEPKAEFFVSNDS